MYVWFHETYLRHLANCRHVPILATRRDIYLENCSSCWNHISSHLHIAVAVHGSLMRWGRLKVKHAGKKMHSLWVRHNGKTVQGYISWWFVPYWGIAGASSKRLEAHFVSESCVKIQNHKPWYETHPKNFQRKATNWSSNSVTGSMLCQDFWNVLEGIGISLDAIRWSKAFGCVMWTAATWALGGWEGMLSTWTNNNLTRPRQPLALMIRWSHHSR